MGPWRSPHSKKDYHQWYTIRSTVTLSSQVVKSLQGKRLHHLSGAPDGEIFLIASLNLPICCVWPLPLDMSSGTTKKSLALSSLYLPFRKTQAVVPSLFQLLFSAQNEPSSLHLSHTAPALQTLDHGGSPYLDLPSFPTSPLKQGSQKRMLYSTCRPTNAMQMSSSICWPPSTQRC